LAHSSAADSRHRCRPEMKFGKTSDGLYEEIGAPVPALPYRQSKKKLKILRMGASGFLAEGGGSVPRSGDIDLAFWSFVSGWLARLDRQWKTAVRTVLTLRGEDDPPSASGRRRCTLGQS